MKRKIFQLLFILAIFLYSFAFSNGIYAASDFDVNSTFDVLYNEKNDYVEIEDKIEFKVINTKFFLQSGTTHTFFIGDYTQGKDDVEKERKFKISSISVIDSSDVPMEYTTSKEKNGISVKVKIGQRILPADPFTLTLKYKTHDLININGNITNMYIPGLANDTKFSSKSNSNLTTNYNYKARIIVSKDFELPSYLQPGNIKRSKDNRYTYYTIEGKDLLGHMAWLQFGDTQYYKFKLVQQASKTDNITPTSISDIIPIISTNIYKIALPREYEETSQELYIQDISPKPKSFSRDLDGNLIATIETPANENAEIIITGLISLSKKDITTQKDIKDLNLSEYRSSIENLPNLQTYIQADKYWQTTDPKIKSVSEELLKKSSTILKLIENDYKYIIDKFDYSDEKLNEGNIRLGAKLALSGSQTICMEYSDSLIAILRAQGIPARASIGYGNDPLSKENKISNTTLLQQKIGHQWVQVWIPNYGWLSIDPTWGESGRKYIGSDLDHILIYTESSSKQNISSSSYLSAELKNIGDFNVYLQALDENMFKEEVKNAKAISLFKIESLNDDVSLDEYVKTSLIGKTLIFIIPIAFTVFISLIISGAIFSIKKYFKRK